MEEIPEGIPKREKYFFIGLAVAFCFLCITALLPRRTFACYSWSDRRVGTGVYMTVFSERWWFPWCWPWSCWLIVGVVVIGIVIYKNWQNQ